MSGKIVENRAGLFGSLLTLIQVEKEIKLELFLLWNFLLATFVLCIGFVISELKIEGQTIYRNPRTAKLQNSKSKFKIILG